MSCDAEITILKANKNWHLTIPTQVMRIVVLPNPWVLPLKVMLSLGFSLEFLETHLYGLSKLWLPPKHDFANGAPFNISQKL